MRIIVFFRDVVMDRKMFKVEISINILVNNVDVFVLLFILFVLFLFCVEKFVIFDNKCLFGLWELYRLFVKYF